MREEKRGGEKGGLYSGERLGSFIGNHSGVEAVTNRTLF
jgi:hypothetical protein